MPKTCPQCQNADQRRRQPLPELWSGVDRRCHHGPSRSATGGPAQTAPSGPAGPAAASTGSSLPPYAFDLARLNLADKIAAVASLVLMISLFLSWFGVTVIGIHLTASGTSAHGFLWIVFIICLAIFGYLLCIAGWGNLPFAPQIPHLTAMIVATVVNLVLVFIAFIDKPGGSGVGWEFGAFLALIAAVVAAPKPQNPKTPKPLILKLK